MPRGRRGTIRGVSAPLALAALIVALAAPAAASAATMIGHTGTPHADNINVPDDQTFLQSNVDPSDGGADYRAPASGVITSWAAMANTTANRTLKLLIFRFAAGETYNVVTRDQVRTLVTPNQLNIFTGIGIPIEAGDYIGTYSPADQPGDRSSGVFLGVAGELVLTDNGEPGATFTDDNSNYAGNRVNVQAVIEPDADRDGFGDETQDQCPTNSALQTACPATPATPASPKKKRCKKKGKKGAAAAKKCKKRKKK